MTMYTVVTFFLDTV